MDHQAQRLIQSPGKPAPKGCAGCLLCAGSRVRAAAPLKTNGGRSIWPRSLLARCVGG
jgi:hypothetical protein